MGVCDSSVGVSTPGLMSKPDLPAGWETHSPDLLEGLAFTSWKATFPHMPHEKCLFVYPRPPQQLPTVKSSEEFQFLAVFDWFQQEF